MSLRVPLELELDNLSQERLLAGKNVVTFDVRGDNACPYSKTTVRPWAIAFAIVGLLMSTALSVTLLISNVSKWSLHSDIYTLITEKRASVQLAIQLISNILGLLYSTTICSLINYGTRIHLGKKPVRLNMLRFWHALCTRNINWGAPFELIVPLIIFVALTATPSAIWAGALTPVVTHVSANATMSVPSYDKASLVHEWPSELDSQGPSLRNKKGFFGYSVGVQMQGSLLSSASSATPVDGGVRQHPKLDYSQYIYVGRSYGIGASTGLVDDDLSAGSFATSYTYQETGYNTAVECIYNASSEYIIMEDNGDMLYKAIGWLPNSPDDEPEFSVYIGHDADPIVAIGVSKYGQGDARRILAIAAGSSYQHLNTTQCTVDYVPTMFNVTVDIGSRNITVTPEKVLPRSPYDPKSAAAKLTHTVLRQLELIANDQTNLYVSLVGSSLNASIADYVTASSDADLPDQNMTTILRRATLPGLANAFTAMLDDMLVAYASAQLMVARESTQVPVTVTSSAMRLGEDAYVYATFAVNCAVLLLVVVEGIRTRGWRGLVVVDYLDPAVLVASGAAGCGKAADGNHAIWKSKRVVACHPATGRSAIALRPDMALKLR